ncbi:MAG: phosphoribosylformylglycinamidine synthase subunit PurS [Microscillaceae bacterium]|jgi:phosphoribosylformylglycinamidine synthase|nr:phosphoribosylformylglycinamidine synthase subunit PurS [Microscillaceae bacterium]
MNFIAEIDIMTKKEILDPQGKAVKLGLENLGLPTVEDVRIGKYIVMQITAENESQAREIVETACQKLLANLIMETYQFEIKTM